MGAEPDRKGVGHMARKPNIIFLHVDQLKWVAIGANGCDRVHTPNLDRILADSVYFERAYVSIPQCVPARTSWYTGLEPEQSGITRNARQIAKSVPATDLGSWLRDQAGYDCYYSGKWHIALPFQESGFTRLYASNPIGEYGDTAVARSAEAFLLNRRDESPFFLNIGLLNPHDICYWSFSYTPGKFGVAEAMEEELPPLPPNFDRAVLERRDWSDRDWRFYAYSYHRYVEMVDEEIGRIYRAFLRSPQRDNTIFIFSSDHGQASGEHGLLTKGSPYEHSLRVPLAVVDPQAFPRRISSHLIDGLDMAPTICDYAGLGSMPGNNGKSFKKLVRGEAPPWREWMAASTPLLRHRVLWKGEYKLVYERPTGAVELFNLEKDPWERNNLSRDPEYRSIRDELLALREKYDSERELSPVAKEDLRRWS